ncbi:MAG: AMP-binding protein, partial [Thermoleophilia bacterium]|nr:AMP-binding protein [Thermoleophilia bacterium]
MTVYRSELTPLSFLRRSATAFPDRIAVVQGERRLTYRELERRTGALAGALAAAGVERGDRVAVLAPNSPALLEAHYGIPGAGAVLVALNVRLGAAEIAGILEHSGARLLLVDRELEHLAPAGVDTVRVDDTGAADDPYE